MDKIVFTNGCFDILHPGHVDLLERARALGSRLIVGINSDASVRRIKGAARPIIGESARAAVLAGLKAVDEVRIFDEATPERLIEEIEPDVLVKGGDWQVSEIVGADSVLARGGAVYSLPLKDEFSTTAIVEKILQNAKRTDQRNSSSDFAGSTEAHTAARAIENSIKEHQSVFDCLLANEVVNIERTGKAIFEQLAAGKKVLICGNGGSAADAQHIAAEFVGRFETERRALPAIALTTDTSALTALGNDYGFERIFARQVEAFASAGDVVVGISTSGNSPNVVAAMIAARERGCVTIGLTGATGKKLAGICDHQILVASTRTARIQEAHIFVGHVWCEIVDASFARRQQQEI